MRCHSCNLGQPCPNPVRPGSPHCLAHDPEHTTNSPEPTDLRVEVDDFSQPWTDHDPTASGRSVDPVYTCARMRSRVFLVQKKSCEHTTVAPWLRARRRIAGASPRPRAHVRCSAVPVRWRAVHVHKKMSRRSLLAPSILCVLCPAPCLLGFGPRLPARTSQNTCSTSRFFSRKTSPSPSALFRSNIAPGCKRGPRPQRVATPTTGYRLPATGRRCSSGRGGRYWTFGPGEGTRHEARGTRDSPLVAHCSLLIPAPEPRGGAFAPLARMR